MNYCSICGAYLGDLDGWRNIVTNEYLCEHCYKLRRGLIE